MEFKVDISSIDELSVVAKKLLTHFTEQRIFTFTAEMGSGKTTFIKELCRSLGSTDNFSSPTYSIVNEYVCPLGKIYHFDLYRLKNSEELHDIGFLDYLDGKSYCFIEWPQLAGPFLTGENVVDVRIDVLDGKRLLSASKHP